MWQRNAKTLCATGAWLLLSLALALTALRLLLPQTALWEPALRKALEQGLSGKVQFAKLGLRLEGFALVLSAQDIEVKGLIHLNLPRLDIQLDIFESLRQGKISLRHLKLYGGAVFLEENAEGQWQINGWPLKNPQSNAQGLKTLLHNVELQDWQLSFRQANGHSAQILGLSLRFQKQPQQWLLWQEDGRQAAQLLLFKENNTWRGQLRLAQWPLLQLPKINTLAALSGSLDLSLNGHYHAGETVLAGELQLSALQLGAQALPELQLPFALEWQKQGLTLKIPELEVFGEAPFRSGGLTLHWQHAKAWQVQLEWLPNAVLDNFKHWFFPESPWHIQSELYDLQLKRQEDTLSGSGIIESFGIRQPALAFSGLSSQFSFEKNLQDQRVQGQLRLKSTAAQLHWPEVLSRDKTQLQIAGQLGFRYQDKKNWQIQSEALEVRDPKTAMTLRWVVEQNNAPASVDGQLAFSGLALPDIPDYLPRSLLGQQTLAWLDQALKAGRSEAVRLLFRGQVSDFPFAQQQGRLEARFFLRQGKLQFSPQWPALEKAEAEVVFVNRGLQVAISQAELAGLRFRNAKLAIADLHNPILELEMQQPLPGNALLRFLRETPTLKTTFAFLPKKLRLSGQPELRLSLTLPLEKADPYRLTGQLQFSGQTLTHAPYTLEKLQGLLRFNETATTVSNGRFYFYNQPFTVSGQQDAKNLTVDLQGGLSIAQWLHLLRPSQLLSPTNETALQALLSGNLGGALNLHWSKGKGWSWHGQTKLLGLEIALPPPFAKTPSEAWPLTFQGGEGVGQVQLQTAQNYELNLALNRQKQQLQLALGGLPLPDPKANITINAQLASAALHPWLQAIDVILQVFAKETPAAKERFSSFAGAINVNDFHLDAYALGALSLSLAHKDKAAPLHIQVKGPKAEGQISLQDHQLTARLQKLILPKPQSLGLSPNTKPPTLPDLDIHIADFSWAELALGEIQIIGKNHEQGFDLEKISLEVPGLTLQGSGVSLRQRSQGQPPFTELALQLQSDNLGLALTHIGITGLNPQGSAEGKVLWRWPNHLLNFAWPGAMGQGFIRGEDLSFHGLDPGIGRLLGLLQLRIDSAFQDGLHINQFNGTFRLLGNQWFIDPLRLNSNLAKIVFKGRLALASETLEALVQVTPKYATGLPLILTATSGPQAGIVALAFNWLLGRQVESIGSLQYRLFGSWRAPKSEWVQVLPRSIPDSETLLP